MQGPITQDVLHLHRDRKVRHGRSGSAAGECVHMRGACMQAHGLGLYGQGSSRLGVEPQYIMQNAHTGTWLGSLRAGFIPPRSRAPIHHAKCTHVCCAVWCVPVACPTHSFGPLKGHPPLACPPGIASFAASSHCHFWSDVSSGSFAGLPRSHPSKQIRRTPTEMRR